MKMFHRVVSAVLLFSASALVFAAKVDINAADAAALTALDGVGNARAQAIVEYRQLNGPFRSVEELARVKGLSAAVVERNRDRLSIGAEVQRNGAMD